MHNLQTIETPKKAKKIVKVYLPYKTTSQNVSSVSLLLPNKHPDKLIYVCYCSTWKCLVLWGVIRK